jgi:catechol 2,3-dioxygenase-like lactoylglutathione lyase family enzyme
MESAEPETKNFYKIKSSSMKINAGVITEKLNETKQFYKTVLKFGVSFENDFYVLMHSSDSSTQLAFLLPEHPSQQKIFQPSFGGKGIFITVEVPDVDAEYKRIRNLGIPIEVSIREEPWGDRHFAIVDPNGIGIDFVTYTPPQQKIN